MKVAVKQTISVNDGYVFINKTVDVKNRITMCQTMISIARAREIPITLDNKKYIITKESEENTKFLKYWESELAFWQGVREEIEEKRKAGDYSIPYYELPPRSN